MLNKRRKEYYASLSREQARIFQSALSEKNISTADHLRYKHEALFRE